MVDYGDWPSDWSAERAVAAGRDFSELKAAHGGLAWVEFDPASARSRLYLWRDGVLEEPTAPDGSVRSRVYEYGGGACCVTLDGLAWVDETDQQVRRWRAGRAAQVLGGGAIGLVFPFGSLLGPLIVWQLKRESDPFVDAQGKEALNFQITVALAMFVSFLLMLVVIGFFLLGLVCLAALVLTIIAGIKANEGKAYRYPFCLRLIK